MLPLILDIMIVALLLITLGAGVRLHRNLQAFRLGGKELQPLIDALNEAAQRAEAALGNLGQMAEGVGARLSEETSSTQRLLDELAFMTKRADQLADRLDGGISRARNHEPKPAASGSAAVSGSPSEVLATPKEQRRRAPDLEQRLKTLR